MRLFSNFIRYLITFLSFPENFRKEKLTDNQKELIKELKIKAELLIKSDHKFQKMLTHKIFSNSVLTMIQSGKLFLISLFAFFTNLVMALLLKSKKFLS